MKKFLLTIVMSVCLCGSALCTNETELVKQIETFYSVMRELDAYYVDTLNYEILMEKAINSMLSTLDPYTVFYPEKKNEIVKTMTSGEYGGIGAVIQQHGKNVCIADPYEGLPAQMAGLKAGDVIVSIDGKVMLGESVSNVSAKLRGTAGTTLKIEVKRVGEKKNLKFEVTREVIHFPPVRLATVISENVGYIQLAEFTNYSFNEFKEALLNLQAKGIKGLIVDLRGNGGGLVSEAVDIASLFLPYGTEIVSTRGRDDMELFTYKTSKMPIAEKLPLAILVDDETASASEILAGAMQDLDRATVIGERTYGKGLVQNFRETCFSSYLKVTIAKYYTPSGRCVQAIDYSHRDANGGVSKKPDSLSHVFHTKKGREVRDGGGITPDSIIKPEEAKNINFLVYLYNNDYLFDFANLYAFEHKNKGIATPDVFTMSDGDYEKFKEFVKEKNPEYSLRSTQVLDNLEEMAIWEGYEAETMEEIAALRAKLTPNIDNDLNFFKKEIIEILNYEIVKRFYYQKGCTRYGIRNDKYVEKALEVLK